MGLGRSQAEMNVTPLIDVLLVLLIIFMIITPYQSVGLETQMPRDPEDARAPEPPLGTVVASVREDRSIWLNAERVEAGALGRRLQQIFAQRPNGTLFVQGAAGLEFGDVAAVIDAARGAGVFRTALMTAPAR